MKIKKTKDNEIKDTDKKGGKPPFSHNEAGVPLPDR